MRRRRRERLEALRLLEAQGVVSTGQLAELMGLSYSYVAQLRRDPEGLERRARATSPRAVIMQSRLRDRYSGRCRECGAKTDGSRGPGRAPELCITHSNRARTRWTPDAIAEALRAFYLRHHRAPTAAECNTRPELPTAPTILRVVGGLPAARDLAGIPRPDPPITLATRWVSGK